MKLAIKINTVGYTLWTRRSACRRACGQYQSACIYRKLWETFNIHYAHSCTVKLRMENDVRVPVSMSPSALAHAVFISRIVCWD